mgnify:CR=1 FL=1
MRDRAGPEKAAWAKAVETKLLGGMRAKLLPPAALARDKVSIRKLTDLKDLYRVFERC